MDEATQAVSAQMRDEFYLENTTDERRIDILKWLQERALEDNANTCTYCHKPVLGVMFAKPLIEGHIYSEDGVREYGITFMCEWCFDKVTKEHEDEEEEMRKREEEEDGRES